ncbi:ribose-5-phosphate isomerase [Ramicandelaber brevisporus]|nr:ribose-5-phosphate isomerase [Ramicandelaber brevisporus]
MSGLSPIEAAKRFAARAAIDKHVTRDTRFLGVGSGSTIVYSIVRLGERVKAGELDGNRLVCVPTGWQSRQECLKNGLRVAELDECYLSADSVDANGHVLDAAIDGADEVDAQLNVIKGGGAAHLREKVVAAAARKFIIVADDRKDASVLGEKWKKGVPIEAVPFAAPLVMQQIAALGGRKPSAAASVSIGVFTLNKPEPRMRDGLPGKAGPVVTDYGNLCLDADFGLIKDPVALEQRLISIPGIVETGLFCNMVDEAWFAAPDGSVYVRKFSDGSKTDVVKETVAASGAA